MLEILNIYNTAKHNITTSKGNLAIDIYLIAMPISNQQTQLNE